MMDCKTKSNILVDAQVSNPGATADQIKKSTLTAEEVIDHLNNPLYVLDSDNMEEVQQAREDKAKALNKIADFREFGLILNTSDPVLSEAGSKFFDNVITNRTESVDFVNSLNKSGFYSGTISPNLYIQGGTVQSNVEPSVLNESVTKFLSTRIEPRASYITGTKDKVKLSPALALDFNKYLYSRYLNTVADLAYMAKINNTEPVPYRAEISEMRSAPVKALTERQIQAALDENIAMEKETIPYNYKKLQDNKKIISELREYKKGLGKRIELDTAVTFFEDQLSNIETTLSDPNAEYDAKALTSFYDMLKLIKNSTSREFGSNPLVEKSDVEENPEIIPTLENFLKRANDMESRVMDEMVAWVVGQVNNRLNGGWTEEEILDIRGLETGLRRRIQSVLGIHHINSHLVKWMQTIVDTVNLKSFNSSSEAAKAVQEKYEAQKGILPDGDNTYRQRNEKGRDTGYVVHLFSNSWFNDSWDLSTEDRSTTARTNRRNRTLALNPRLLFDTDLTTSEETAKRNSLELLKETLEGDLDTYLEIAREKYELYKNAKELVYSEIDNNPDLKAHEKTTAKSRWDMENSPLKRLENERFPYVRGWTKITSTGRAIETNPTTEKFLVRIPRRTTPSGTDLGYYDSDYKEIRKHKATSDFYDEMVKSHRLAETSRGSFAPERNRVQLAFIGKSISELVAEGDYDGAMKLAVNGFKDTLSMKEILSTTDVEADDVTGDPQLKLHQEVHTIPTEVSRRVRARLEENDRYLVLDRQAQTAKVIAEKKAIYTVEEDKVYNEISADLSEDLLQSVVMAIHSRHTFIEKQLIEAAVNLGKNVLMGERVEIAGKGKDASQSAKRALEDHMNHYINIAFYDGKDEDATTPIFGDVEDEKKGIGTRKVAGVLRNAGRLAILGWSPIHAVLNVGQQFFSNLVKSQENTSFTFEQMMKGYKEVATHSGARDLVDKLYIVGDVAFSYEKRTIYEQNTMFTNLINPMWVHTTAEKFNQGSTAIAAMYNIQLNEVDESGKKIGTTSLFEALEDGKLPENFRHTSYGDSKGSDLLVMLTVDKVRPVVMKTAGDYLSPLLIEKGELGKLFMMFRKWLPEMLVDRLHGRRYDYAAEKETEGRLYALGRALRQSTTEVGRAAIRGDAVRYQAAVAGAKEVALAMIMQGMLMALGTLSCDTPQCKEKHPAALMAINIFGRLTGDVTQIAFPPSVLWQAGSNPFAISSILKDVGAFTTEFTNYIVPGGATGIYSKAGPTYEAGDVKFISRLKKVTPIARQWYNYRRMSSEVRFSQTTVGLQEDFAGMTRE